MDTIIGVTLPSFKVPRLDAYASGTILRLAAVVLMVPNHSGATPGAVKPQPVAGGGHIGGAWLQVQPRAQPLAGYFVRCVKAE